MKNARATCIVNIVSVLTFVLMIVVNALADLLPLNGVTMKQISDMYENLFTPAPYTFLIWGVIYILVTGYLLFQLGVFGKGSKGELNCNKIGLLFSLSSLANAAWIFAWHYDFIGLSVLIMAVLLISLILISNELRSIKLTAQEKLYVKLPFSVYFAWITVATIANITVFLVSIDWNGFGLSPALWTMIMLLVGAAIGILTMLSIDSIAYGLTLIWAYTGILVNHLSADGFDKQYPLVIAVCGFCILLFLLAIVYLYRRKRKQK